MFPNPHRLAAVSLALAALAAPASPLGAQAGPPSSGDSTARGYKPPTITLARPADGEALPHDKPVVLFRFAAGEEEDPLDLTTFRVRVDGVERTELFSVTAGEAWGPLGPPAASDSASPVSAGLHRVEARICSTRGACTMLTSAITVSAAPAETPPDAVSEQSKRNRMLELLLDALRVLLRPRDPSSSRATDLDLSFRAPAREGDHS